MGRKHPGTASEGLPALQGCPVRRFVQLRGGPSRAEQGAYDGSWLQVLDPEACTDFESGRNAKDRQILTQHGLLKLTMCGHT